MIDWQPFECAPKDGRYILVWATSMSVDEMQGLHVTFWMDSPDGVPKNSRWYKRDSWYNATAWAEINPPEPEEQSPTVTLTEYKVPGFPEPVEPEYYTKVKKLVADEQDARIRSEFMKSELIKE